ncbi:Alginate export protein [Candidatus Methylobacter favarea]|uniref:Alginate export protein n=1 Tax=Candidatus Methylobacter favarea TaxID=2707345 RepID=A0A8S0X831_9GAMM|nr:alginate export family protein [Candidatus Methylobacter favarea]CAA9890660.1 Alginate export protein [Candidatus Methylobacter favarea]
MLQHHRKISVMAAILSMTTVSPAALADITRAIEDALNFYHYGHYGAIKADLNYRYENVDQDKGGTPNPHTANANTARLRIGFLSPVFHGLQGYAEYEGNLAMQEDYNSLRNGKTGFSTVADPEKSELNQLWISYAGIPDTVIKGGRQRIKLDDDRFIGNVGWRQMEQTYDSVLITHNNQQLFGLTINAGFIGNVQTFTSTTENIDAPLLNINYKVGDYGNLVGYGYWLDYTETENYEKSSQTYGVRFNGSTPKIYKNYNLHYTAEWGLQQDYGHGKTNYEADRINVMGGFTAYNFTFQGAVEQLSGQGVNKTFDTPLGTNHAFQGWADLFLVTPANGIRDVFGTVIGAFDKGNLIVTGVYHDFSDDTGSIHYGREWDVMAVKKFGKHYSLLAKYAYYDDLGKLATTTDTQKIWFQASVTF